MSSGLEQSFVEIYYMIITYIQVIVGSQWFIVVTVQVVMVADPQNSPRPFVLMSLIKGQPHTKCSFYKLTSKSGKEVV